MKQTFNDFIWREVRWQRPYDLQNIQELLTHLATLSPRGAVIWEVRGGSGQVRHLLGADRQYCRKIQTVFTAHGNIRFSGVAESDRPAVTVARQLKITKPVLSLKTDLAEAIARAGLSALMQAGQGEQVVLQIVLGGAYAPVPVPHRLADPHASWLQVALGNVNPASAESRTSVKEKTGCHSFNAVVRLGATGDESAGNSRIQSLLSAIKTLESAGVTIRTAYERADYLDTAYVPWRFPLRLSVKELSNLFLLPVGDVELPGVAGLHPKLLTSPAWYQGPMNCSQNRTFALGSDCKTKLSISPRDALEHTVLLGPTGSGKSTAMQNLILSDIYAGRSVLVIDPKADLVNDILSRIPEGRSNDVVVIDPSDPCPAGFNPLAFTAGHNADLVSDAVLAVFKAVFAENWGIRSQDVLSAALLTLARVKGASLLWLPAMLTNEAFRRKITAGINDKIGLAPFWSAFDDMKDSERRQEIAPVLNKVRQFLLRPGLRGVLGQSDPKFALSDLFYKPRIVLVPLNKGLIGTESARLLGSLIVGQTWTLALSRAREPADRRHLVSVFIDELQDYLSLPTDLSDALAQARGLGVGLTMAHQYRSQLPKDILAGVDANARNKIIFGLSAGDARDMAAFAPELTPEDFMALPRYHVYTSLQSGGKSTGWMSGHTLAPPQAIRSAVDLRAKSMAAYGKPIADVEAEYLALLDCYREDDSEPDVDFSSIGRRRRL
jgi:hypothetical protein